MLWSFFLLKSRARAKPVVGWSDFPLTGFFGPTPSARQEGYHPPGTLAPSVLVKRAEPPRVFRSNELKNIRKSLISTPAIHSIVSFGLVTFK